MLVHIKLNPECKDGIPKIGGTLVYANQTHTINLELPGVQKAFEHYKNKGAIEVIGGLKPEPEPESPAKPPSTSATPKVPPATPSQAPKVKNQTQEAAKKDAGKDEPKPETPDAPPNPPEDPQQGDPAPQTPETEKGTKPENPDKKGSGK